MTYLSAGSETTYEKLLSAARVLFYNHGINGTGIDSIVKRADVAKKACTTTLHPKTNWCWPISEYAMKNGFLCIKAGWNWSCPPESR